TVVAIRSAEQPAIVIARYPGRVIYIGGGPPVWTAYAQFIRRWDITRLPYDGAADRWFDPAWIVPGCGIDGACHAGADPTTHTGARAWLPRQRCSISHYDYQGRRS